MSEHQLQLLIPRSSNSQSYVFSFYCKHNYSADLVFPFLIAWTTFFFLGQILPQDLLKKYITYAKLNVFPKLHDSDMDKLTHVYAELRRESSVSFWTFCFIENICSEIFVYKHFKYQLHYVLPAAWTRGAYSCETHWVNDSNVWSTCQDAPETACYSRGCGHGNSGPAWFIHLDTEIWSTESSAEGIKRNLQPAFAVGLLFTEIQF